MKVAYLGKIQLSDVDLSYLHAAQKDCDITYFMEVNPRFQKGSAFNFKEVARHDGVFKAIELYPELKKLEGFINTEKFYIVNTYGRFWALKSIWVNICLLFVLLRKGFRVVHIVWPLNIYEFALYALRKRMILTVHDPFPHEDSYHDTFIVRLRRWCAFHLVKKFIILNKKQRQQFLDFYKLKSGNVFDSRLSAYDYLATIKQDLTAVPKERYILFAGRISEYKGVDFLLKAMDSVHLTIPDVKLVVAGNGQFHFDTSKYEKLEYIEFRNRFIPDEELVALISHAQFVVCPYTNATQSGVIMSAFAFLEPVIATEVGGLPEMVGYGKLGIIVPPSNEKALAEAIVEMSNNDEMRKQFVRNISEQYQHGKQSWTSIAAEIKHFYAKI